MRLDQFGNSIPRQARGLSLTGSRGLIGTLEGGAIGAIFQRRERGCLATAMRHTYVPQEGVKVIVERVWVGPAHVKPGQTVDIVVTYALLAPDTSQTVRVTERREIRFNDRVVANLALQIDRQPGTWSSALWLTLPPRTEPGTYTTTVSVQAAGGRSRASTAFVVGR